MSNDSVRSPNGPATGPCAPLAHRAGALRTGVGSLLKALLATAGLAAAGAAGAPPDFTRDGEGLATNGQTIVQPAGPRKQILAIIPDRTTGRDWGLRYLAEAVDDFNRIQPDAVFCVGDLVQGYSRSRATVRAERDDFLEIVRRLRMPFYPTAGNHDVVSGDRERSERAFEDEYRALFGPLYYAVELELASVVILNTEDGDGLVQAGFSDTQLAWLDETLARLAARGRPIILLFHRPLWDHRATNWDTRVQPILVRHGVDYVIAGHYHSLQMLPPKDGIPFLVLGTCGGAIDQHPLGGQLQHTTFVVVDEAGAIEPYHQIAGTTLPVDWITKDDQDRSYRLKGARDAVVVRGAVPDALGAPSEGSVELVLKNPLDRAITLSFETTSAPGPWIVDDRDPRGEPITRVWTSRTAIDTFNPSTTDLASPYRLELPTEPITLEAGASTSVRVRASADLQITPPAPPPFDVIARFEDSKGRLVPIVLRQRLPIARTIALGESLSAATAYPIGVWEWTPYDTPDANPTAGFARTGDGGLLVSVRVPDLVFSPDARPTDARGALDDPLGDAVRVVLGSGAQAREHLVTFDAESSEPRVRTLAADGKRLERAEGVSAILTRVDDAWSLQLSISQQALPAGESLDDLAFNLGVADNDETFHTQWRWLAPRAIPALLRLGDGGR
jgi:hypothetical protein